MNLLKQYMERDNIKMTVTPGRRDFPGGTREETQVEIGIEVQGANPTRQHAAVNGISKIVIGASADCVKELEDLSVDDENLLNSGVLRPKEHISDICLEMELSSAQQNEIMGYWHSW